MQVPRRPIRRGGGAHATGGDIPCPDVRFLMCSFVDEEGDDLQRARIDRHLRQCPSCREFEVFVRGSGRVLRDRSSVYEGAVVPAGVSAATLAREVRRSSVCRPRDRRPTWRSSMVLAAAAAALSLGVLIGGLGVWTLSQGDPSEVVGREGRRALPRVVAVRTLDPGSVAAGESILTAWIPPRNIENTFDEKPMYWATPMSHFARHHYRPEQL
ncbi:MAG: zf-HC2 domain-containing protein [Thermoleophilia bacterium]